ncbi:MAG: pantothenate kinase [Acidobacteria bacterium]|jgi:type III pantothenate kinase|nr:pantothenate kinase [Acidobacteriota bacterium]
MLMVLDVGNTNTVLGVYRQEELLHYWRLATERERTSDEWGILLRTLFSLGEISTGAISAIVISSVVPPSGPALEEMALKYFGIQPLFIDPTMDLGMAVRYHPPEDVGADRIVNAIAACEHYGCPAIVVDFGTATTFDAISEQGEYVGGVIAPGIGISAEALFLRAARLPRVEVRQPRKVIGDSTVGSMQSGLYWGYAGLVDGVLKRMKKELEGAYVVSTGGLAELISPACEEIDSVEKNLTLEGMRLIHGRLKK